MFHYSTKNISILRELQAAYGMKAIFTVKAIVTRWLSHGAACKRCIERYVVIIEALDNVLTETEKQKPEVESYHATLLQLNKIMQIALLDDVLSTTSALCLLLQSDKKDFGAVNRAVNFTVSRLENITADKNADIFGSFKKSSDLIDRANSFNKQPLTLFQTLKRSLICSENEVNDFCHKTAITFLKASIKKIRDTFNLDNLPVLLATMALACMTSQVKMMIHLILMGMTRSKPFLTCTVKHKTMCLMDIEHQVSPCSHVHRNR